MSENQGDLKMENGFTEKIKKDSRIRTFVASKNREYFKFDDEGMTTRFNSDSNTQLTEVDNQEDRLLQPVGVTNQNLKTNHSDSLSFNL